MNIVEPYHPIIRSGADPGITTAFSWLVAGRTELADRAIEKLDADAAMRALTAASDMAIALGRRLRHLRDSQALPSRIEEPCAYCGKPDCADRWDHDRLDRGHEVTWWKWGKR